MTPDLQVRICLVQGVLLLWLPPPEPKPPAAAASTQILALSLIAPAPFPALGTWPQDHRVACAIAAEEAARDHSRLMTAHDACLTQAWKLRNEDDLEAD
jgi:hypothetical protein